MPDREYEKMKAELAVKIARRREFCVFPEQYRGCTMEDVSRAIGELRVERDATRADQARKALLWPTL